MLPDRVSNPGPLTYKLGALPIALCVPATHTRNSYEKSCRETDTPTRFGGRKFLQKWHNHPYFAQDKNNC